MIFTKLSIKVDEQTDLHASFGVSALRSAGYPAGTFVSSSTILVGSGLSSLDFRVLPSAALHVVCSFGFHGS